MARLMCVANGNNTSASTWALIDSTSFNESESSSMTVPTSYATTYTTFSPGAITIDGIGIRVNNRTGTTGTFSVELYNSSLGTSVAGTEVTVNCSDFVDASSTAVDGGWMFFKFSSSVLLLVATNYIVRFKTSSSTQIVVASSTTTNPSRFLRTTTTQAPVAGDDRFVMGEWTAASATTTRTVTLDDTSTVDYGSASTSVITPALSISAGGIVLAGTTASTTYVQKISGTVVVYNGGILRLATSGSRMPTTSSFTWTFDSVSNVDFGINVKRKGEFTAYGESKQRWTLLTADKAIAATVIAVTSTSGWKNGDSLLFGSTSTSAVQSEIKNISTVDSSTQVTLSAGLTNAHTGTGDLIGECANVTSNIVLTGTSSTVGFYVCYYDSSIGVLDNIMARFFGSVTANKRGIEYQHTTSSSNSVTLNSCAFRDFSSTSGTVGSTSTASLFTITNNVIVNSTGATLIICNGASNGTFDVSSNFICNSGGVGTGISIASGAVMTGGTCTNNRICGPANGLALTGSGVVDNFINLSGFVIHACSIGMSCSGTQYRNITSFDFIQNATGMNTAHNSKTILTTCNFYGNSTAGISATLSTAAGLGQIEVNSCNFRGRASSAQAIGYSMSSIYASPDITFNNCDFGSTTAHSTSDIGISALQGSKIVFNKCNLNSTTEITSSAYLFLDDRGYIGIQRKDGTTGNHATYIKQGILTPDTTIFRTASPSLRITPKSASITCSTQLMSWKVPINSGQTCSPTVYVRESESGDGATYNGNRVKLYVKSNYNLGITSDTLLSTATSSSDGAWEQLTGVTSTVTDTGVLEFYCVLDGTTGWVNLDDFSAINT